MVRLNDFAQREIFILSDIIDMAKAIGSLLYRLAETLEVFENQYDDTDIVNETDIDDVLKEISSSFDALGALDHASKLFLKDARLDARNGRLNGNGLLAAIEGLRKILEGYLFQVEFLCLIPEEATMFRKPYAGWEGVRNKLNNLGEDIQGASRCFSVGEYTACVFHLMRIMEVGVQLLGKKLKVEKLNTEWGKILRGVNAALQGMTDERANSKTAVRRKSFLKKEIEKRSQQAIYLKHVKDAWRNRTMHPKQTYTEVEARDIYRNVCIFMNDLCK